MLIIDRTIEQKLFTLTIDMNDEWLVEKRGVFWPLLGAQDGKRRRRIEIGLFNMQVEWCFAAAAANFTS